MRTPAPAVRTSGTGGSVATTSWAGPTARRVTTSRAGSPRWPCTSTADQRQRDAQALPEAADRNLPAVPSDGYGAAVYGYGPDAYWRIAETAGTTAADSSLNGNPGTHYGPTLGGPSAIDVAGDGSAGFDPVTTTTCRHRHDAAPDRYSAEGWFRTRARRAEALRLRLSRTGTSAMTDRHVFMTKRGRCGSAPSSMGRRRSRRRRSARRPVLQRRRVAPRGRHAGTARYTSVRRRRGGGQRSDLRGHAYAGYWRAGADSLAGWPERPSSDSFAGDSTRSPSTSAR